MAGLIKRGQVDGLVSMKALLDGINEAYPASKITTQVIQTPETSEGAGDQVYYTGQQLLAELKLAVDSMSGGDGSEGLNLPALKRLIDKVNAELNGGTYEDNEGVSQTLTGFKNKEINDVVRVEFTYAGGTATPKNAVAAAAEEFTSGQTVSAYTAAGAPIVGVDGSAISFDYDTKTFSAAPYVLDIDATKASGGIDAATGQVIAGQAVYTAFTGDFKVFPVGTWTLETLPATALLDNNEMQLIAYDQALQKVIIQLASDKNLIDRIVSAVGETAVTDAVKDATERIDARIDRLEGTDDQNLAKVAVKVSQIAGKPLGDTPAETVTKTTEVASKAYVDDVDNAIKADIGAKTDITAYNADGSVKAGTVRGELNSIEAKFLDKTALINDVKASVTETQDVEGTPTPVKVTSDENTINETALVTKFAAIDQGMAADANALSNFINTTAPATYVAQTQVSDTYTKLTKDSVTGEYTYTYTDANHKDVVGLKLFNEKISALDDSIGQGSEEAYKHGAIVLANEVLADATKGITAKTGDVAHVTNGVADDDMPVYSQKAIDNKVDTIKEETDYTVSKLDEKTYDWNKIAVDDGTAVNGTVTKTTFTVATGAATDATSSEVLVAAGTAETASENTAVLSAQLARKELAAVKSELEAEAAADKLELKNRIEHGDAVQARALAAEVARLTATAGDTLAGAAYGQEAIVAAADGAIKQLQDSRVQFNKIAVSEGIASAILDANNNVIQTAVAAESAASLNTVIPSKQYVDDATKVVAANAAVALVDAQREMDARVDAIEAVTEAFEHITPVSSTVGGNTVETITIGHAPIDPNRLIVTVNGIDYNSAHGQFTISGTTITWDSVAAGFALADVLDASDTVDVLYKWNDASKVTPIA